jgi:hypothetical protein
MLPNGVRFASRGGDYENCFFLKSDVLVPTFWKTAVPSEWKCQVEWNFLLHSEAGNSMYLRNGGAYLSTLSQLQLSLPQELTWNRCKIRLKYEFTEEDALVVTHQTCIKKNLHRISAENPAMITEVVRGFSQNFRANSGIVWWLCHNHFVPDPLQIFTCRTIRSGSLQYAITPKIKITWI